MKVLVACSDCMLIKAELHRLVKKYILKEQIHPITKPNDYGKCSQ